MFRTIERRLVVLTLALVAATAGSAWLLASGDRLAGVACAGVAIWLVGRLRRGYRKFNSNVIFLLNALENGDYSFSFSAADASRERRDVNTVLNAIKEILAHARETEIENEKFLSVIVAAVPVGIVIVDERDFVRVANEAALRLLGMHVFTHLRQLDEAVLAAFGELAPGQRKTVRLTDERDERHVSLGLSRITTARGALRVVTMSNIAGELEEREIESFTKLIRVMTHEIMNSIAPITSLSETMAEAWEGAATGTPTPGLAGAAGAPPPGFASAAAPTKQATQNDEGELPAGLSEALRRNTADAFGTIGATARGLQSFVESYRRFTGIPRPELREIKLAPFVERTRRLVEADFADRRIEVTTRFDAPDLTVLADEGQVGQVLVNLLKNAAEAAPTRIEIRVGGGYGHAEPGYAARVGDAVRAGLYIEVSNDGEPIPEEVKPQIFVPFFTTKTAGTGIGLSVSRHIMRLHGGNLKHRTEGRRTIFTMTFRPELR